MALARPILSMLGFDKLDFLVSIYVFMIWTNVRSTWVPPKKMNECPQKGSISKGKE